MGWAVPLFAAARGRRLAALVLLGWGLLIEGLQGLLPWRSIEVADVAANTLGVALGALSAFTPWRGVLVRLERRAPGHPPA
jgi:VanZ family protein